MPLISVSATDEEGIQNILTESVPDETSIEIAPAVREELKSRRLCQWVQRVLLPTANRYQPGHFTNHQGP